MNSRIKNWLDNPYALQTYKFQTMPNILSQYHRTGFELYVYVLLQFDKYSNKSCVPDPLTLSLGPNKATSLPSIHGWTISLPCSEGGKGII
jgi:hypothetical protein